MDAPGLQIAPAFAVPIITTRLPKAQALNDELTRLFLAREGQGDRYRKKDRTPTRQVNIFESEFDLFSWPEPPIQQLRAFCLGALSQAIMQLNDYSPEQAQALPGVKLLVDCWFHVTRFGGYIGNHTHPMASWSGVYCVRPGEDSAQHPASGSLCFTDTRSGAGSYVDPANVRLKRPFAYGSMMYKQQAGDLILFPSHLPHQTEPFFGRDERITVAFNCAFTRSSDKVFGF